MTKLHPIFEQAMAPFLKPVANRNGRLARCYCGKTMPSSPSLAFFEFRGEGSMEATEHCKCGYHRIAHEPDHARRVPCREFTPKGAQQFDMYYCGCRGWD